MDVEDMIERLCVAAGMIMEDASVSAISTGGEPRERILKLLHASEAITALERFPVDLNRRGFPWGIFSDSGFLLAREAGMDGSDLIA